MSALAAKLAAIRARANTFCPDTPERVVENRAHECSDAITQIATQIGVALSFTLENVRQQNQQNVAVVAGHDPFAAVAAQQQAMTQVISAVQAHQKAQSQLHENL